MSFGPALFPLFELKLLREAVSCKYAHELVSFFKHISIVSFLVVSQGLGTKLFNIELVDMHGGMEILHGLRGWFIL